jgi:hypothetical protein
MAHSVCVTRLLHIVPLHGHSRAFTSVLGTATVCMHARTLLYCTELLVPVSAAHCSLIDTP